MWLESLNSLCKLRPLVLFFHSDQVCRSRRRPIWGSIEHFWDLCRSGINSNSGTFLTAFTCCNQRKHTTDISNTILRILEAAVASAGTCNTWCPNTNSCTFSIDPIRPHSQWSPPPDSKSNGATWSTALAYSRSPPVCSLWRRSQRYVYLSS